jgi:DivIVA domain-containing protein
MALTPEDVRNKQFTTVRFKEGYDLDEVDNFLDEIEESLSAVTREVEDLRATAKGEVPESIREEIRSLGDENARLKSELDQAAKALQDSDARVVVSDDTAASDEALKNFQARVNELELQLSNSQSELAASLAAAEAQLPACIPAGPGRAWLALTFHELIVVVLQRRSLLRHG